MKTLAQTKSFSQFRAANHVQKSVSGANLKHFHKFVVQTKIFNYLICKSNFKHKNLGIHSFAPQTIFKNLLVAGTKNIFIGSWYKMKSSSWQCKLLGLRIGLPSLCPQKKLYAGKLDHKSSILT